MSFSPSHAAGQATFRIDDWQAHQSFSTVCLWAKIVWQAHQSAVHPFICTSTNPRIWRNANTLILRDKSPHPNLRETPRTNSLQHLAAAGAHSAALGNKTAGIGADHKHARSCFSENMLSSTEKHQKTPCGTKNQPSIVTCFLATSCNSGSFVSRNSGVAVELGCFRIGASAGKLCTQRHRR